MMQYRFDAEADRELNEALRFYDDRSPGLGRVFLMDLHATLQNPLTFPLAAPIRFLNLRVKQLRKFSYSLIYAINDETLIVYAVMHQKQRPGYWLNRITH